MHFLFSHLVFNEILVVPKKTKEVCNFHIHFEHITWCFELGNAS